MFNICVSRTAYLLLACTGQPVHDDFLTLIDVAASVCQRENWSRVLVDCSSLPPTLGAPELAGLGRVAGAALARRYVALVVADTERFAPTQRQAEDAGSSFRLFTNHLDASDWLSSVRDTVRPA